MKKTRWIVLTLFITACSTPNTAEKTTEKIAATAAEMITDEELDSLATNYIDSTSSDTILPASTGRITDNENIFTPAQEKELENLVMDFENKTSNQTGVLTVSSIHPYKEMGDFSVDVFNTWGIGQKDKNNGLLITVSSSLRLSQITTGLGTEKILTDEICKQVMDEILIPHFKKGNYFEGTRDGLKELFKKWEATSSKKK